MAKGAQNGAGKQIQCSWCKVWKDPAEFYSWKERRSSKCRRCESAYHVALAQKRRAEARQERGETSPELAKRFREMRRLWIEGEHMLESWEAFILFNIELWAIELEAGRRTAVHDLEVAATHPEGSVVIALAAAYTGWDPARVVGELRKLVPPGARHRPDPQEL